MTTEFHGSYLNRFMCWSRIAIQGCRFVHLPNIYLYTLFAFFRGKKRKRRFKTWICLLIKFVFFFLPNSEQTQVDINIDHCLCVLKSWSAILRAVARDISSRPIRGDRDPLSSSVQASVFLRNPQCHRC